MMLCVFRNDNRLLLWNQFTHVRDCPENLVNIVHNWADLMENTAGVDNHTSDESYPRGDP